MKNLKSLLTAIVLAASASASAQFTNSGSTASGGSGGWSTFNVQYNSGKLLYDVSGAKDQSFTAFTLEYTNALSVSQSIPLFVEWGVGLQYGFFSESEDEGEGGWEQNFSMLSVPIPVNLVYDFQIPNSTVSIDPYVGLKLRGIILAQTKEEESYRGRSNSETFNYFDKDDVGDDNTWKRIQIGWQIGVNARFNNKYMVGLSYGSDLSEVAKKTKIGQFSVKLGLVF